MSQKVYSAKYRYLKRCAANDLPNDIFSAGPSKAKKKKIDAYYMPKETLCSQSTDYSHNEPIDEQEPIYQYDYEDDSDFNNYDRCESEESETGDNNDENIAIQNNADLCLDILNSPTLPNSNVQLISFLTDWSKKFSVTHIQITTLLKGLNRHLNLNLPVDARTILKTQRNTRIQILSGISGNEGGFTYLGISKNLERILSSDQIKSKIKNKTLQLIFNVDGVPVSKSTNNQFWPILGKIFIPGFNIHPFVIAIYFGDSKPNLQCFLDQFIVELNMLLENDFFFNGEWFVVQVLAITCDAPARAFLKAIIGHNGTYGCERCMQKGESIQRRMVFKTVKAAPRTDTNFRSQEQKPHHNGVTPILNIKNLNVINIFVLDYMHLCCIGIMKKLLRYWFKDSGKNKLHVRDKSRVSDYLLHIRAFLPSEFSRKSRSLKELENWKATELRSFMVYIGIIVMKNILPNQLYTHFLYFHCAMRILLSEKAYVTYNVDCAQSLIEQFIETFPEIYGPFSATYNVHSLLHVCDDALNLNISLDDISCFSFESYLGRLLKLIRTPHKPLAQVLNRLSESQSLFFENQNVDSETCIHLKSYRLSSVNSKDGFVLLKNGSIVKITLFEGNLIYGYKCLNIQDFYTYPFPSSKVGVYKFGSVGNSKLIHITQSAISKKLVVVQDYGKRYYIAIEMLHINSN